MEFFYVLLVLTMVPGISVEHLEISFNLAAATVFFFLLHFLSLQSSAIEKSEEATTLFCNHLHFFLLNIRLLKVIGLVCNFRWPMKNR